MTSRRHFIGKLIRGGLAAWVSPATLADAESCISDRPLVSVFDSATEVQWISRPIREDAPETLQAFLRRESSGIAVLVAFPPGWQTKEVVYYNSDEAIFVLDGDFGIGGHTLRAGQYCYLPDRMVRRDIYSQRGALVIAFFTHPSKHEHADPKVARDVNKGLLVVDPTRWEWVRVKLPRGLWPGSTVLAKPVHEAAGTRLYLLFVAPGFMLPAVQLCNVWQEWFVLSGRLLIRDRRCGVGTYGFFKPGTSIGPVGTETGTLILARFDAAARLQIIPSESARLAAEAYLSTVSYLPRPK